jgi:hypothetical protein
MTDEQIKKLFAASRSTHGDRVVRFARMVELQVKSEGVGLSHDDVCRLSKIFNSHSNHISAHEQTRINEWLKTVILSALMAKPAQNTEAREAQRIKE